VVPVVIVVSPLLVGCLLDVKVAEVQTHDDDNVLDDGGSDDDDGSFLAMDDPLRIAANSR